MAAVQETEINAPTFQMSKLRLILVSSSGCNWEGLGVSKGLGSPAGRSLLGPGEELAPPCDFLLQPSRILESGASSVPSVLQVTQSQDAKGVALAFLSTCSSS